MARIEWVAQRLENWALWSARGRNSGQGFASQSAFLNIRVDGGGYREAVIPVDEIDAAITDEAVSALKPDKPHLHATVVGYYLDGLSVLGVAQRMDRAQSTVKANLAHADAVLAVWFGDRKRKQEADRREFEAKLKAARPARLDTVSIEPSKRRRKRGTLKISSSST